MPNSNHRNKGEENGSSSKDYGQTIRYHLNRLLPFHSRPWTSRILVTIIIFIVVFLLVFGSFKIDHTTDVSHRRDMNHWVSGNSSNRALKLQPPFQPSPHIIRPQLLRNPDNKPVPTHAFWTNFLLNDEHGQHTGEAPVTLSPYTVKSQAERLEISYGDTRRLVMKDNITEGFNADLSLGGAVGENNSYPVSREVYDFDSLSVTLRYYLNESTENDLFMDAKLVRGSPYITIEYANVKPIITIGGEILSINDQTFEAGSTVSSEVFELIVAVGPAQDLQKWLVFLPSENTFTVGSENGKITHLVSTKKMSGAVRAATVPNVNDDEVESLLRKHSNVYPVGSTIETNFQKNGTGILKFGWETKFQKETTSSSDSLFMVANPHHVDSFSSESTYAFHVGNTTSYRTLKANMTAVLGNLWVIEEELTNIGFDETSQIDPAHANVIKSHLKEDLNFTPSAEDPYFFGKEVARQARLVLIADRLNDFESRDFLLDEIEKWVYPWLVGKNSDYFVYDPIWGGICSVNGLKGVFWMTDFGNGWYNDHHFHYGYFLYSIAVLAKYRQNFVANHKLAIYSLYRDIANSRFDDPYFPLARHFSWFDGHSFASGIFVLDGGKSQESVSEAINAYYGVYLLGLSLNEPEIQHMGQLLLAMEMRAAQKYWQMPSTSTIYEPFYAANKMNGQIGCTKVMYTTWFGAEIEHIHLINMIPFTPITQEFIHPDYVKEEYPVIVRDAFGRENDPINDLWKGYAYLDQAIIDPSTAWSNVLNLSFFDDGNSLTNSLYWIAIQNP